MQVELTEFEIDLLDKALVAWQGEPQREGFAGNLMGAMLRGLTGKTNPEAAEAMARDAKLEKEKAEQEGRMRERQAVLLRAKLEQARQQSKVAAAFTLAP
jgi:hypothetical protein